MTNLFTDRYKALLIQGEGTQENWKYLSPLEGTLEELLCAAYNLTNTETTCGNVDSYFWLRCIPPHRGNPKIARVENYFGLVIASYDGKEFKKDLFE